MKTSRFFRGAATTAMLATAAMALTALGAVGGGVAATSGLASCIATDSYVYSAQKYDPTADCVSASRAIEVVRGSGASATCPAMCLTVGEDLYVSTLCPPLPTIATAVDADAGTCIAALAAAATGGTCDLPADGGAAGVDAGDADAAADEDADTDAAGETDAADSSPPPADASDAG